MTHAQGNIKRLEMSSKTPGRQQTNLGKEVHFSLIRHSHRSLSVHCRVK